MDRRRNKKNDNSDRKRWQDVRGEPEIIERRHSLLRPSIYLDSIRKAASIKRGILPSPPHCQYYMAEEGAKYHSQSWQRPSFSFRISPVI